MEYLPLFLSFHLFCHGLTTCICCTSVLFQKRGRPSLSVVPVSSWYLHGIPALGAGRRGAVQQWLSQYLQIPTGGSCSDMSLGQQILWNSAMVAVVLSLLHLVWHISPVNPSCLLFISPVLTLAVIKWHLDALRCLEVFQESCYSYFFSVASLLLCK